MAEEAEVGAVPEIDACSSRRAVYDARSVCKRAACEQATCHQVTPPGNSNMEMMRRGGRRQGRSCPWQASHSKLAAKAPSHTKRFASENTTGTDRHAAATLLHLIAGRSQQHHAQDHASPEAWQVVVSPQGTRRGWWC